MKISDLLAAFYPPVCTACGRPLLDGEEVLCLNCYFDLPRTYFEKSPQDNELTSRLVSLKAPICSATALYFYERSSRFRRPILAAKYEEKPSLGRNLMRIYARELHAAGFFDGIDTIVPVPLHPLKLIRRGYNQSYRIALGITDIVPRLRMVHNGLYARYHSSQTRLSASGRMQNAAHAYRGNPTRLAGAGHILVVDDIITTGSTILACCRAIHNANPTAQISVISLGAAHSI